MSIIQAEDEINTEDEVNTEDEAKAEDVQVVVENPREEDRGYKTGTRSRNLMSFLRNQRKKNLPTLKNFTLS